jgi:hypothetical protein
VISFIVPTVGRESLARTLASIETLPGDEVVLVGSVQALASAGAMTNCFAGRNVLQRFIPCPPGRDWGHAERNFVTPLCRGRYLAHIDDDDWYAPGTRVWMQEAITQTPDRPVLFRMRFPNGITLWQEPELRCGNMGTPCILIPNEPTKLGTFGSFVGGDCHYMETMKWRQDEIVWRPEVIALLGHNI